MRKKCKWVINILSAGKFLQIDGREKVLEVKFAMIPP